ncbi:MAG: methionine synthase [Desulfobacterota bacterium]|nr:methionine synthase [Thermodesulfobacteriota bacterium]
MVLKEPFLATSIGSFPHLDETEVLPLIRKDFPHIPFLAQFPRRSFLEGMVAQYSEGFPGLRLDLEARRLWVDTSSGFETEVERFYQAIEKMDLESLRISREYAAGLRLLEILSDQEVSKGFKYVKAQVTGPITFGLSLTDQERRPIFYDPTLREVLIHHLAFKARWLEKRLRELFPGIPSIIFFDEPALSAIGSAFSGLHEGEVIQSLSECFRAVQGLKGVHCCGNTDWPLLLTAPLDILSFDAYGYLDNLSLYPKELAAFLERGGILAWGLIPTGEEILKEDVDTLAERLRKGVKRLTREGIDPGLLNQAILTPSCGMGSLSVPLAERVCHLTSEVSRRLREEEGH